MIASYDAGMFLVSGGQVSYPECRALPLTSQWKRGTPVDGKNWTEIILEMVQDRNLVYASHSHGIPKGRMGIPVSCTPGTV